MLDRLAAVARIAAAPAPVLGDVVRACGVIASALKAEDASVIRAGDPHFVRLGSTVDPTAYEMKQRGYWLVWKELAANSRVAALLFSVTDRLVHDPIPIGPGVSATHLATILPSSESNSDLLTVRGPWPRGLTPEEVDFVDAVRPILAYLVSNVLDGERAARQRDQLGALADVAAAFSRAEEMDHVLTVLATALAKASGFDWARISLLHENGEHVVEQALNVSRHSGTETAALSGANESAAAKHRDQVVNRRLAETREPYLIPDVFANDTFGVDDDLRRYYERAHILSVGTFPILFGEQLLGVVRLSSSTPREFAQDEVAFLKQLVSQAATTVKGLQLYRELMAASKAVEAQAAELDRLRMAAEYLASHDSLTGLLNRRAWFDAAATGGYSSLAIFDVDHFKDINDQFGHPVGDAALQSVAQRLVAGVGRCGVVGRLGGEEFGALFEMPLSLAEQLCAKAIESFWQQPFVLPNGIRLHVTVSAGLAPWMDPADPVTVAYEAADRALYEAKYSGRNRLIVYRSEAA